MNFLFSVVILCLAVTPIYSQLIASADLRVQVGATLEVEISSSNVTVTMIIDDNRYIAAGFGRTSMSNTYAIIAYKENLTPLVQERKLGSSGPSGAGTQLPSSVIVTSDTVTDSIRTITCVRDITVEPSSNYYDFSSITQNGDEMNFIWAYGADTDFEKHQRKGSGRLTFYAPTVAPSAVPTNIPTQPTVVPSAYPTEPSAIPTTVPSLQPTGPTIVPTLNPSTVPSVIPTDAPTFDGQTEQPTRFPITPSTYPTTVPTSEPTDPALLGSVEINSSPDSPFSLKAIINVYNDNSVILSLIGPPTQWYGFGFGGMVMNHTYTIIIDADGNVSQRRLAARGPGQLLEGESVPNLIKLDNNIVDGERFIELETDINELPFDVNVITNGGNLEYIMATGETATLSYHDYKEFGMIKTAEDDDVTPNENGVRRLNEMIAYLIVLNLVIAIFSF